MSANDRVGVKISGLEFRFTKLNMMQYISLLITMQRSTKTSLNITSSNMLELGAIGTCVCLYEFLVLTIHSACETSPPTCLPRKMSTPDSQDPLEGPCAEHRLFLSDRSRSVLDPIVRGRSSLFGHLVRQCPRKSWLDQLCRDN